MSWASVALLMSIVSLSASGVFVLACAAAENPIKASAATTAQRISGSPDESRRHCVRALFRPFLKAKSPI